MAINSDDAARLKIPFNQLDTGSQETAPLLQHSFFCSFIDFHRRVGSGIKSHPLLALVHSVVIRQKEGAAIGLINCLQKGCIFLGGTDKDWNSRLGRNLGCLQLGGHAPRSIGRTGSCCHLKEVSCDAFDAV